MKKIFLIILFILCFFPFKTNANTQYAELNGTKFSNVSNDSIVSTNGVIYSYRDSAKVIPYFTVSGNAINRVEIPYPIKINGGAINCNEIWINTPAGEVQGQDSGTNCYFYQTNMWTVGQDVLGLIITDPSGPTLGAGKYYNFQETNGAGSIMNSSDTVLETNTRFTMQFCDSNTCNQNFNEININDTSTRIISMTPEEGTTTPSNVPINFSLNGYISPDDVGTFSRVRIVFHNIDQNVLLLPDLSNNDVYFQNDLTNTSGYFSIASSTTLADGNYRIHAELQRAGVSGILNFFSDGIYLDHQFIVGSSTFIGNISQNSFTQLQTIFGSTTATTTSALAFTCSPVSNNVSTAFLNTTFNPIQCITFLLIPDSNYLNESIKSFKNQVSGHFPLGYLTDFINIMQSTTTIPLIAINATLPTNLPGGGSHITLDLTNSLNTMLNATTSIFTNESASSTETFYEITSYYWNIIVYILTGLYIISRVIGSHLIPTAGGFGSKGSLSDTNSNDDSYRLKEYLYNHANPNDLKKDWNKRQLK